MEPVKVGIVGSGFISGIYLENSKTFNSFDVVACADLIMERAQGRAEEYGVPKACSTEEVMDDPEIELVLNLTTPDSHYDVAKQAIRLDHEFHLTSKPVLKHDYGPRYDGYQCNSKGYVGHVPN